MNRLAKERSAYLRHAADQRIDWYPWCEEAFEEARKQDKPIFLSSGAIWCHWCHVMAEESFEDEEIIGLLNRDFICIKLDRDERPDIDRRLQMAVQSMTGTSGWPLSVFMTHDGKPFFGGTYFPPDDRFGRPGFKRVLRTVAEFYKDNKDRIREYSDSLHGGLVKASDRTSPSKEIDNITIKKATEIMLSSFDLQNGGFGTAPKFPMPGALSFLINLSFFDRKNETLRKMLVTTLLAMAEGGIHDQIGGGFHRYSTDEAWIIPHFEKMADDNAMLLRNYIDAYSIFKIETFGDVAKGIVRFVREVLSDPEGGFYASQDADVTPDDEGGYFTWRDEELREVLDDEEYEMIKLHLWNERGTMPHDSSKRVLFVSKDIDSISDELHLEKDYVLKKITEGKERLLEYRKKRKSPFIDTNLYTSLNGMMIASFIKAYRVFADDGLKAFAIESLDRILSLRYRDGRLFHSDNVEAMLDDYVYLIDAIIAIYEITGLPSYIETAENLIKDCINGFYDSGKGGFYDTAQDVLGFRIKGIEDIPHPSPNSIAIMVLLRLFQITERNEYLDIAINTIKAFLSQADESAGIHYGSFYDALNMYLNMLRLSIYSGMDSELTKTAISLLRPYTTIQYPARKDLSFSIPGISEKEYVLPCLLKRCLEPIFKRERLEELLIKGL